MKGAVPHNTSMHLPACEICNATSYDRYCKVQTQRPCQVHNTSWHPSFVVTASSRYRSSSFFVLSWWRSCKQVTFRGDTELPQLVSSAVIGSGFIVMVLVLRLYLGYSHVGSRLLSASVEYEETGWYDGQVWVKSPAMLMRDRLLGIYQVKPTLEKLKASLLGLSGVWLGSEAVAHIGERITLRGSSSRWPARAGKMHSRHTMVTNSLSTAQVALCRCNSSKLPS